MNKVKFSNIMNIFKETILNNKKTIFFSCVLDYFILYILASGSIRIQNIIFSLFVIALTISINCGVIVALNKSIKETTSFNPLDIFILSKSKLKLGLFWYLLMAFLNAMLGIVISLVPSIQSPIVIILSALAITSIITPLMIISISGHAIVNKKNYIYVVIAMIFIFWINLIPMVGELLNFIITPFIVVYLLSLSEAERRDLDN